MRLSLNDIPSSGRVVSFQVAPEALEGALSGCEGAKPQSELFAEVEISRTAGRGLVVKGRMGTTLTLTCARCLESHPYRVDREFQYHLVHPEAGLEGEVELKEDELDVAFFDGRVIDLGFAMTQELNLALPYRFLCSEGCKGLCPRCGKDLSRGCECGAEESSAPLSSLKSLVLNR